MSSFGGVEFSVMPVENYLYPGVGNDGQGAKTYRARILLRSEAAYNALRSMFSTVNVKRPLNYPDTVIIVKGGHGFDDLVVPGSGRGEGHEITYTQSVLTAFSPVYDAWRDDRFVAEVEFTIP